MQYMLKAATVHYQDFKFVCFYAVFSIKYKRKFQWLLQDHQTSLFLPFLCEDDGGGVPNVEQSGEGEPHFSLPVCVLVIL